MYYFFISTCQGGFERFFSMSVLATCSKKQYNHAALTCMHYASAHPPTGAKFLSS